ncbi:MAG: DUF4854 domain-containing protein [Lachnospiraceae bacterium]|nr:DUF4854 domain-containing protein [Lachnospiraceae bacterium]
MKLRAVKVIACAAVMALALSATACGSKEADKTEDNAAVENTEDAAAPEDAADTEPEAPADTEAEPEAPADNTGDDASADNAAASGDAVYSTLEEYYNDPAVKSILDSAFESLKQEGMTLSIEVKGNVFSMTCKFEDSSMIVDGIAEALEQGLDASASQFETQAAEFDEAVGQSGACTVAVRYTDPDDKVLAEREFKAQ